MSKLVKIENINMQYPNEYKISSTERGTSKLEPAFGAVTGGSLISAETTNEIQKNGVLFTRVIGDNTKEYTKLALEDAIIETELFDGLKLMLHFKFQTSIRVDTRVEVKDELVPIIGITEDRDISIGTTLQVVYLDGLFFFVGNPPTSSTGSQGNPTSSTGSQGNPTSSTGSQGKKILCGKAPIRKLDVGSVMRVAFEDTVNNPVLTYSVIAPYFGPVEAMTVNIAVGNVTSEGFEYMLLPSYFCFSEAELHYIVTEG